MTEINDIKNTVKQNRKAILSVRLKHVMKERGVTQQELADRINISRQLISQYVNGKSLPRSNTLRLICEALKIRETWLLGYKDLEESKKDNLIPLSLLNKILDKHFQEIEKELIDQIDFLDDSFIKKLKRIYISSFQLNYIGLTKIYDYQNDIVNIKRYRASASYDYKDPKSSE